MAQSKIDPVRVSLVRALRPPQAGSEPPEALRPLLDLLSGRPERRHPSARPDALADVVRAYMVADALHEGQVRKSGEPFVTHPLGVATIMAEMRMDVTTVVCALLHDVVEDTDVTLEEVREWFGDEAAEIIDGLTKIAKIGFRTADQAQAENYRKMMVAMARDVRVIIIKLADRLHNLRTLEALPREKQELKAKETLEIYVPLANRLGMARMKAELEDLGFRYLYPKRWDEVVDLTDRRHSERAEFLDDVVVTLRTHLEQAKIHAEVLSRAKNYYSIYQKMVERGRAFDEIFDLVGVRIIVEDMRDCYAALGVVHALWKPMPGRFKDYIAMPKFNLYQSLHTTVMGPKGKEVEIQIRTRAMHRMAEYGVASHWRYKEQVGARRGGPDVPWLGEMVDLQTEKDPREFMESLRLDLFHDEVFCFTPKGDVKCLPRGAGPLDFAYSIHTEVGHRTVGAKVNGRLVPLDTRLESGDVIELMTTRAPEAHPKQDWLAIVKTSRARSKIRAWFAAHRREEAREQGREVYVKVLRREGVSPNQVTDEHWRHMFSETRTSGHETFYEAVGEGKVSTQSLLSLVHRIFHPDDVPEEPEPRKPPLRRPRKPSAQTAIVAGASDVVTKLARCCTPVPGDKVIGFITRGKGVSVHRVDCPNSASLFAQPERLVEVEWDTSLGGTFGVALQVLSIDRVGLLRDITNTLADCGVSLRSSTSGVRKDGTSAMRFSFELGDVAHLDHIVNAVRKVEGVFDVYRVLPREART